MSLELSLIPLLVHTHAQITCKDLVQMQNGYIKLTYLLKVNIAKWVELFLEGTILMHYWTWKYKDWKTMKQVSIEVLEMQLWKSLYSIVWIGLGPLNKTANLIGGPLSLLLKMIQTVTKFRLIIITWYRWIVKNRDMIQTYSKQIKGWRRTFLHRIIWF